MCPRTSGTLSGSDIKAANDREEKYCRDKFPVQLSLSFSLSRAAKRPVSGLFVSKKLYGSERRQRKEWKEIDACPLGAREREAIRDGFYTRPWIDVASKPLTNS